MDLCVYVFMCVCMYLHACASIFAGRQAGGQVCSTNTLTYVRWLAPTEVDNTKSMPAGQSRTTPPVQRSHALCSTHTIPYKPSLQYRPYMSFRHVNLPKMPNRRALPESRVPFWGL